MSFQRYELKEYADAGCMQMEVPVLGAVLWRHANGVMCDGCPKCHGGNCDSLRKMQRPVKKEAIEPAGETVRAEATRRGIGIKEVRRQRRTAS